jgi:transcriptional regulator with PAS, ATPase and Fis domain
MQALLLRFLENGELQPVGSDGETCEVDVRVIASTNRRLGDMVAAGQFREDLLFRINVAHINIPPLRERPEDIPLFVEHFLRKYSPDHKLDFSPEILEILMKHTWEGNVRELEHVIERMVLLNRDGKIDRWCAALRAMSRAGIPA